ncbi:MAG: hypothetical protein KC609_03310 [Myxococcales bacterium]|nr:hypothetical protein [Myxococcales bacterium]
MSDFQFREKPPIAQVPPRKRESTRDGQREESRPATTAGRGVQRASGSLPFIEELEQSFGTPLGGIPVAQGGEASAACDSLGADGYQFRGSIALGPSADKRVVSEEVAHALQYQRSLGSGPAGFTDRSGFAEQEAEAASLNATRGGTVGSLSASVGDFTVARSEKNKTTTGAGGTGDGKALTKDEIKGNCENAAADAIKKNPKLKRKSWRGAMSGHVYTEDPETGERLDPTLKDNVMEHVGAAEKAKDAALAAQIRGLPAGGDLGGGRWSKGMHEMALGLWARAQEHAKKQEADAGVTQVDAGKLTPAQQERMMDLIMTGVDPVTAAQQAKQMT